MRTAFIGIDPGLSGGIAVIFSDGSAPVVHKMPETERDVWDCINEWSGCNYATPRAAIEAVHAMPKQGVTSTFTFGKGYGALRMALTAAAIPFRDVTPRTWQKELGCLTGGDKNVSKAKAQQLFPSIKITHAIADALLIAEWLRRQP